MLKRSNKKRRVNDLSGGEGIIIALTLCLAVVDVMSKLKLLILDESTVHLDLNELLSLFEMEYLDNLKAEQRSIIFKNISIPHLKSLENIELLPLLRKLVDAGELEALSALKNEIDKIYNLDSKWKP